MRRRVADDLAAPLLHTAVARGGGTARPAALRKVGGEGGEDAAAAGGGGGAVGVSSARAARAGTALIRSLFTADHAPLAGVAGGRTVLGWAMAAVQQEAPGGAAGAAAQDAASLELQHQVPLAKPLKCR